MGAGASTKAEAEAKAKEQKIDFSDSLWDAFEKDAEGKVSGVVLETAAAKYKASWGCALRVICVNDVYARRVSVSEAPRPGSSFGGSDRGDRAASSFDASRRRRDAVLRRRRGGAAPQPFDGATTTTRSSIAAPPRRRGAPV